MFEKSIRHELESILALLHESARNWKAGQYFTATSAGNEHQVVKGATQFANGIAKCELARLQLAALLRREAAVTHAFIDPGGAPLRDSVEKE